MVSCLFTRAPGAALLAACLAARTASGAPAGHPRRAQHAPLAPFGDSTPALTLAGAVAHALANNLDVRIARARLDSARAEGRIARALPNPVLTAQPGLPSQYSAQLPLDVGPLRHFRTRTAALGLDAAQYDLADAERQARYTVRAAFYDLLLADSLQALAAEQARIFRQLLVADSTRLRAGSIAERDVVTTSLQLAHAEASLARAVAAAHAARFALESAMGETRADTALRITGALRYAAVAMDSAALLAAAPARRADVMAAEVREHQSESLRSLTRASLIPMPTVGVAWQPSQPYASGLHYAPAVGLTLPLLDIGSGERARAAAGVHAAQVTAARTRAEADIDVAAALDAYRSTRVLAERYEGGLLADASAALTAARYAYDRGATSLLDLLDAVRTYGDTRTDYLIAAHDYWLAVFALQRATGVDVAAAAGVQP